MFKRKTLIAKTSKDVYLQDSEPQSGLPFSNQMHQEYRNACFTGWVAPCRSLEWQCCCPLHQGCELEIKAWCTVSKHLSSMWRPEFNQDKGPLSSARVPLRVIRLCVKHCSQQIQVTKGINSLVKVIMILELRGGDYIFLKPFQDLSEHLGSHNYMKLILTHCGCSGCL